MNPGQRDSRASTLNCLIPNRETQEVTQATHTEEVIPACPTRLRSRGKRTDSLPAQGPFMALSQTLTGRQPPGRAAECTDLRLHMGFRPDKEGLHGGKRRWGDQTGTQNPNP